MPITRVYAPKLSGLVDIAQGAGAAEQQLQYDQLRQRERLARMQFASQRLGAQDNLNRMQFGAQLQQQRDAQGAAVDFQRQQRGFDFAGEQTKQNQEFQSQQAEAAFLRNQQADTAAAAQRQGLMESSAALNYTYSALARNDQQIDEFNKTIAPRLNNEGQKRHAKLMLDLKTVDQQYDNGSGKGQLNARQWAEEKARLQDAFLAEKWDRSVMENGTMPGDKVVENGMEYVVQPDGVNREPARMINEREYAESTGYAFRAPDGTIQSITYTNPITRGRVTLPNPDYEEHLEAQKAAAAEYKEDMKEYNRQASAWDLKLVDLTTGDNEMSRDQAIKKMPPRPVRPTLNAPKPFGALPEPAPAVAPPQQAGPMAPAPVQEQPQAGQPAPDANDVKGPDGWSPNEVAALLAEAESLGIATFTPDLQAVRWNDLDLEIERRKADQAGQPAPVQEQPQAGQPAPAPFRSAEDMRSSGTTSTVEQAAITEEAVRLGIPTEAGDYREYSSWSDLVEEIERRKAQQPQAGGQAAQPAVIIPQTEEEWAALSPQTTAEWDALYRTVKNAPGGDSDPDKVAKLEEMNARYNAWIDSKGRDQAGQPAPVQGQPQAAPSTQPEPGVFFNNRSLEDAAPQPQQGGGEPVPTPVAPAAAQQPGDYLADAKNVRINPSAEEWVQNTIKQAQEHPERFKDPGQKILLSSALKQNATAIPRPKPMPTKAEEYSDVKPEYQPILADIGTTVKELRSLQAKGKGNFHSLSPEEQDRYLKLRGELNKLQSKL